MQTAIVILAAGKGTRMKSEMPKVLHEVAGAPLLVHCMKTAQTIDPEHLIIVAGHGSEDVTKTAKTYAMPAKMPPHWQSSMPPAAPRLKRLTNNAFLQLKPIFLRLKATIPWPNSCMRFWYKTGVTLKRFDKPQALQHSRSTT